MSCTSTSRHIRVGSIVRVISVPPGLSNMPHDTRRVFRAIIGHRFKVRSIHPEAGVLELNVARVVDPLLGTIGNTVWIEPSCVA